jgi:hypothetical protein
VGESRRTPRGLVVMIIVMGVGCSSPGSSSSAGAPPATPDGLGPQPLDLAVAGFFKFGAPNEGLNVGTLAGDVFTINVDGYTSVDGDGGVWASGPAGGTVLYGEGRNLHSVNVETGADSVILVAPADIRDGVVDPEGLDAYYLYQDCCGAEVWRTPLDGSRDPERVIGPAPRPVAALDAILAAKVRLRTQLAIAPDGETLVLLECELACRLQMLDLSSGATNRFDPWMGPTEMTGVSGALFISRGQSIDLRNGQVAGQGGDAGLDCRAHPLLVIGVNVLDLATGEQRIVPVPAGREVVPAVGADIVGSQGVELPNCWVLAIDHFPGVPGQQACDGQYVAMNVDTGDLFALEVLGRPPFCG